MWLKSWPRKVSRRQLFALALIAPIPWVLLLLESSRMAEAPTVALAPVVASTAAPKEPAKLAERPFTLRAGQTFGQLFADLGLDSSEATAAVAATGRYVDVRRVKAGEQGVAYFDAAGELRELRFKVSKKGWLTLTRELDQWRSSWREMVTTVELRKIEGNLQTFLFDDLRAAGGSPQLAFAMADVLQWDVDFNRDLKKGDRFGVVFEEVSLDGEKSGLGRVVALYYENSGRRHEAYLYSDEQKNVGYYDGEGRPLQKMFLKSPLPFMRVTSRFSYSRLHPVLKVYRPHLGVDLGAPLGTPVRATAGGSVIFAGTSGGAGRMVTVRHTQGFETSYLHLSKFGEGIRVGSRVGQGDIVGYVGNSGHSTGAHLDYRVKKNGQYIDPLSMKNVPVEPIAQYRLAQFLQYRDQCRTAFLPGGQLEPLTAATRGWSREPISGATTQQVAR